MRSFIFVPHDGRLARRGKDKTRLFASMEVVVEGIDGGGIRETALSLDG